jgi:hypothetical protein
MDLTEAEQREFEIDEVLALSLRHDECSISAEDSEMALLQLDREASWRVLTGPQTHSIVVILELGYVHIV